MPIRKHRDSNGYYYQFGNQHKYYFDPNNIRSEIIAYRKALAQAKAIEFSKHHK